MIVYDMEGLAKIEQKSKIDPKQQKNQDMYDAQDKLPENNMSFLTGSLKDFEITFKNGKNGKEYASSSPGEKLQISDQGLFASKKVQNPYDNLLEKSKDSVMELNKKSQSEEKESFVKKLGLEKNVKTESFVERMQAGKYGNI